jgi:echinoderm microtubule-associated protein-like 6
MCRTMTIIDTVKQLSMTLAGHSSTIRSIDWSMDSKFVMSTDQACEVVVFDVHKRQVSKDSQRDQTWASWTSVLGFPVMGIWPSYTDGTDVNAVNRSPCGQYVLTADDSGLVSS